MSNIELSGLAVAAHAALGTSTNVLVSTVDGASRYVQFVLRCSPPGLRDKQDGVATVIRLSANGHSYVLPEPLVVANGKGMSVPGAVHYLDLVRALQAVGLVTNDVTLPE